MTVLCTVCDRPKGSDRPASKADLDGKHCFSVFGMTDLPDGEVVKEDWWLVDDCLKYEVDWRARAQTSEDKIREARERVQAELLLYGARPGESDVTSLALKSFAGQILKALAS